MEQKVNLKDNRTVKRYSESFKQKVLQEITEGRITKAGAHHKYGMGFGTIYAWIRKYRRLELYNPKIRVEMPQELDEIKALKKRIKELENALVNTQLKHLTTEAELIVALQELGYNSTEDFKKKEKSK